MAAAALLLALAPPAARRASALTQVTGFGSNPGNLLMFEHVPAGMPASAPLVVVLHGCTQTAAAMEASGWTALGNAWRFYVVYAQQQSSNNSATCFNFFEPGDQVRGAGEALSIKQMVDRAKADHSIDPARVYVVGFSAGGGMAPVMAAAYPDVFAGAAALAGLPYECASTSNDAWSCMNPGRDKTPQQWGDLVRGGYPGYTGSYPRLSIWHGTTDTTVVPSNLVELMEQWTNVHGADQQPDLVDMVRGYPHRAYRNAAGATVVETYEITGMGHAVAIDPQYALPAGAGGCGTAGAYIADKDICSAYEIARSFGLDSTDNVAPSVTLTSPADGATVSGTVNVTATASDDVGVGRVETFVDTRLASTDTAAPYVYAWSTATEANGAHTLLAKAYDAAGNVGSSVPVTVTVTGGITDTTPPTTSITSPAAGATVYGSVNLQAQAADDVGVVRVELHVDGVLAGTGTSADGAGPYQLTWNTTAYADGAHTLESRAYDAAGNVGTSAVVTVTIDQGAAVFRETWSDRDGNADAMNADGPGWTSAWATSTDDARGTGSRSAYADASRSTPGTTTKVLSRTVTLGANPRLGYWRKLDLRAAVNMSTTAKLEVVVNNGTDVVVDQKSVTYATYTDSTWTERVDVDLSAWAFTTVTLSFRVTVTNNVYLAVVGKAWIDDITVGPPTAPGDVTPPSVDITAPASGSTVSGTVDVLATASDDVGVVRVELYLDGSLQATDTAAPYVFTWETAPVANGSHALMAKAYDAANNIGVDNDTQVTVANGGGGPVTVTFAGIAVEDGYVKAYADGSAPAVGTIATPAVGRGTDSKLNRTVFSFDTAALPDGATVTRAYLTVAWSSGSGDPWASPAGNTLVVDAKAGTFGAAGMETSDWAAAPTASAVATLVKFTSGMQRSADFSAAGLAAVNRTGRTQLKLRFALDPTATAYLFLREGTEAKLTVEYR
jgi:poly(hydroxyalkanoate) depolymerase family esterase